MSLEDFLALRQRPGTVKLYVFEIEHFKSWSDAPERATYDEVMAYLAWRRKQGLSPTSLRRIVYALKAYFFYLIEMGKRTDHPARSIRLRDAANPPLLLEDLLTEAELQSLLKRPERFPSLASRNAVILGLLVHQALRLKELVALKIQDVDLQKAKLEVMGGVRTNGRTLDLQASQVMPLHQYLSVDRPGLLRQSTDALLLSQRGHPERGDGILYLVKTLRDRFPAKRLTPTLIRQSVIALRLQKGEDLRRVQRFAGHQKISSTERYRATGLEQLRQAVEKYHPLQ